MTYLLVTDKLSLQQQVTLGAKIVLFFLHKQLAQQLFHNIAKYTARHFEAFQIN